MSEEEIKRVASDSDYWRDFIDGTGYSLYGFTGRQSASFHKNDNINVVVRIDSNHMDLIKELLVKQWPTKACEGTQ